MRLLTPSKQKVALDPSLTSFLLQAVVKLRWDESGILPQTQVRFSGLPRLLSGEVNQD